MSWGLDQFQLLLESWPDDPGIPLGRPIEAMGPPWARLAKYLGAARNSPALLASADFRVLVRQAVRQHDIKRGEPDRLRMPRRAGWSTEEQWRAHGFMAHRPEDCNEIHLQALAWRPKWLEDGRCDPFSATMAGVRRRRDRACAADPAFVAATKCADYLTDGQREAVRSFMLSPPGSTTVVTLPTGSGKSMVGYLPSLLGPAQGRMTVFVVPTVALALDQAAQYAKLIPGGNSKSYAWYGGMDTAARDAIRSAMRTGTQHMLFCSPESVCGSLRRPLATVAAAGGVECFVVDEAHLLAQWGDSFRVDYQMMAAVWKELRQACSNGHDFRTLLMTATLTGSTLELLRTLFASDAGFGLAGMVAVREEPEYWLQHCATSNEADRCMLEAINHAPRPAIVYLTRPEDADRWATMLRKRGYQRVAAFHGKTPHGERERVLQQWQRDELDLIVATSAFGVGVDKSDVRAVLHRCMPETLDRYYQEVGRTGRDGLASAALLVCTDDDVELARKQASPRFILTEKAKERWDHMLHRARYLKTGNGLAAVDVDTVLNRLTGITTANRVWNQRVLLLMARAGMLELQAPDLAVGVGESPRADEEAQDDSELRDPRYVWFRLLVREEGVCEAWSSRYEPTREGLLAEYKKQFDAMKQVLRGRMEMATALDAMYELFVDGQSVAAGLSCAGCRKCRQASAHKMIARRAIPISTVRPRGPTLDAWRVSFGGLDSARVIVTCPDNMDTIDRSRWRDIIDMLIRKLDIHEISMHDDVPGWFHEYVSGVRQFGDDRFLVLTRPDDNDDEESSVRSHIGKITIMLPTQATVFAEQLESSNRPLSLYFVSSRVRSARRPYRSVIDVGDVIHFENLEGAFEL